MTMQAMPRDVEEGNELDHFATGNSRNDVDLQRPGSSSGSTTISPELQDGIEASTNGNAIVGKDGIRRTHSENEEVERKEAAANAAAARKLPDEHNPHMWSDAKKIRNNCILCLATFSLTYSSSVMTPSLAGVTERYNVSLSAAIVSLSLFVLGFGLGPFLMGPTSDVVGRRMVYVVSYASFAAFSWGVAYAPNFAALVIFRLLAGLSGASSLNNHPASISDFTSPRLRNRYSTSYAFSAFSGASIAPLVGGFIVSRASWHWNLIVTAILVTISWLFLLFGVNESCAPVLLAQLYKSEVKLEGAPTFLQRYKAALIVPWKLLFTEPIIALTCFYLSFLYAVFYAIFPIAPIIYVDVRGWTEEQLALSYISPTLGFIAGALILRYGQDWAYDRIAKQQPEGKKPPPDARFAVMLWFSWIVPVGIFLLAFCSYRHTHWLGDALGFFLLTCGMFIVFSGIIPFTIDLFVAKAASALAAQVATRAIAACAFPLFSRQMYYALGIPGASCLLAGIAVLLTPMPFIFKRYGKKLWAHKV